MPQHAFLEDIKRLKTIADLGLLYCTNDFDKERYLELQEMSFRMLQQLSDTSLAQLKALFAEVTEYPTVKVDIRALVLSDDLQQVLLVQEGSDGRWAIPGGWADIGFSPREILVKEVQEETGLQVAPLRLLAIFDKKMHPHPTHLHYVYKLVFHCRAVSAELQKGFDVLDARFFDINTLPELSEDRILKSQIQLAYQKVLAEDRDVYFD
jgi:ADP-ribose pyrophosphatase YjhB (NUDIX family)